MLDIRQTICTQLRAHAALLSQETKPKSVYLSNSLQSLEGRGHGDAILEGYTFVKTTFLLFLKQS